MNEENEMWVIFSTVRWGFCFVFLLFFSSVGNPWEVRDSMQGIWLQITSSLLFFLSSVPLCFYNILKGKINSRAEFCYEIWVMWNLYEKFKNQNFDYSLAHNWPLYALDVVTLKHCCYSLEGRTGFISTCYLGKYHWWTFWSVKGVDPGLPPFPAVLSGRMLQNRHKLNYSAKWSRRI